MRWTEYMAEAIVKLRAIYLSGDFDRYLAFSTSARYREGYFPTEWAVKK